jgi:hypothetical protein
MRGSGCVLNELCQIEGGIRFEFVLKRTFGVKALCFSDLRGNERGSPPPRASPGGGNRGIRREGKVKQNRAIGLSGCGGYEGLSGRQGWLLPTASPSGCRDWDSIRRKNRNRCDSRGRVIMAGSTGRSETQVTERSGTVIDTFPSFGHEEWMPGEERSVVDEHTNCGPASGWGGHGLGVPRVRQLEEGPAPGSSGYVRNVGCKVSVTRAGSSGHGIPNCTPCFTGAPLWNPPRPTLLP